MHYERYSDTMFNLGHGYPLFQADPYDLRETLPGDAGYLQRGKFIPRWNYWGEVGPSDVVEESIPVPGPLHAGTFKEIRAGVDIGATTSMGGGQLRMKYECASSTCAILCLKDRQMKSIDLSSEAERQLKKHIHRNISGILESCHLDDSKRLVIVTGVSKTGDWDTAVITSDDHEAEAEASIDILELDLIKTSFAIKYKSTQTPHFRNGHHHARDPLCDDSCINAKNQCVFIRRLLVRKAMRVGPLVLKAGAEPKEPDLGDSDGDVCSPAVLARSEVSSASSSFEFTDGESQYHGNSRISQAESTLFRHIFENSDAEYAMIHDRDIAEWMSCAGNFELPDFTITASEDGKFAELSVKSSSRTKVIDLAPCIPESQFRHENPEEDSLNQNKTVRNSQSITTLTATAWIPSTSVQIPSSVESEYTKSLRKLNRRADDFRYQGKYSEAEAVRRVVLEHRKRLLGTQHVDTLRTMDNLASDLHLQRGYVEAEKVRRAALEGQITVLGSDHIITLRTMHNLASDLRHLGECNEAEEVRRVALEGRKRVLGPEHLDTLYTMHSLASDLRYVLKYYEAEEFRRAALEGRRRVLGPDHVDTLRTMHSLASDLRLQQKYSEAEEVDRAALEGRLRALGSDHFYTLRTMENLASDLCNQGKYDDAEEIGREILETRMRVLGPNHVDTLRTVDDLDEDGWRPAKDDEALTVTREPDLE